MTGFAQPDVVRSDAPEGKSPAFRTSKWLRHGILATIVMLFLLVALAAFVPIGGAVIGTGQIGVQSRVKRISHLTGGVVESIYVKDGDRVRMGQALIALDDQVSSADAEISRLSVAQLMVLRARLEAERLSRDFIAELPELQQQRWPDANRIFAREQAVFRVRQRELRSAVAQLLAQVTQLTEQIDGYEGELAAIAKQQALIGPELEGVRSLWERGLVTLARKNQLERTVFQLERESSALQASIAQARVKIGETQQQIAQLKLSRKIEADDRIANINNILNQQRLRSVSAQDTQEKSVVRATDTGLIYNMAVSATGDTVKAGETIFEIVPDDDRLIIVGRISPSDIDQVRQGQAARVRFSSLSASKTPEFFGKVSFVAPEVTTDLERNFSYYAVHVHLDAGVERTGTRLVLKPGMPADIFIETGNRSMLSYLTKPITDQFARAFRENP